MNPNEIKYPGSSSEEVENSESEVEDDMASDKLPSNEEGEESGEAELSEEDAPALVPAEPAAQVWKPSRKQETS